MQKEATHEVVYTAQEMEAVDTAETDYIFGNLGVILSMSVTLYGKMGDLVLKQGFGQNTTACITICSCFFFC